MRYHRAAYFDDRLRIWTRCVDVRGARFRFEYAVDRDGELVADGSTAHACVDASTLRPTRVPAWFVEAIARAEASDAGAGVRRRRSAAPGRRSSSFGAAASAPASAWASSLPG